jgi:hypothetical protein
MESDTVSPISEPTIYEASIGGDSCCEAALCKLGGTRKCLGSTGTHHTHTTQRLSLRIFRRSSSLTITVLVEKAEGLLEFGNLLFGQLVSHGFKKLLGGSHGRKRQTVPVWWWSMDKSDRGGGQRERQGERDRLPVVPRFGSFGALAKGHWVICVCPATDCRISSSSRSKG